MLMTQRNALDDRIASIAQKALDGGLEGLTDREHDILLHEWSTARIEACMDRGHGRLSEEIRALNGNPGHRGMGKTAKVGMGAGGLGIGAALIRLIDWIRN